MEHIAVEALALDRAVEALDPAICPRVVRLGAGVPQSKGMRALMKGALVSGAVISEHPLDADARASKAASARSRKAMVSRLPQLERSSATTTRLARSIATCS